MSSDYDYLFKILLIGDSGVGKSSLMRKYINNEYNESYISTIGVDFSIKTLNIDNKKIKIQIWDTAGQERFKTIISSYYRGAHGILVVFDITNKESFQNITNWLQEIEKYKKDDIEIIIIGTKNDMMYKREVDITSISDFINKYKYTYIETSAKNGNNVENAFIKIINQIMKSKNILINSTNKPLYNSVLLNNIKKNNSTNSRNCYCL